ncbi:hypothetical protein ABGB18_39870 [Nonomuraea sp. B12E4]|uniref:hypothetical protein n=1 Tax=Nonomuraea sp. B12E4 TaxID=3153564 RepID=UPI00325E3580
MKLTAVCRARSQGMPWWPMFQGSAPWNISRPNSATTLIREKASRARRYWRQSCSASGSTPQSR